LKPRILTRIIEDYRNIILDRFLPVRKTEIDGLTFYYKRDPPQDIDQLQERGFEFHGRIRKISGEIAIDVGANIGSYSLQLSKRFHMVIAFEPDPHHRHFLRMNVASNSLGNVRIEDVALSDRNGMMPLYIRPGGATSLDPFHYGRTWNELCVVKVARLDDIELPPGRLSFVKIDAENLELHILRGALQLLQRFSPILAVEVHGPRVALGNRCSCDVCSFLKSLGYDVEITGAFASSRGSAHWVWATPA